MVDNIRNEQYSLIIALMNKYQFLDDAQKRIWFNICNCCSNDIDFFYRIYDSIITNTTDSIQSKNKKAEFEVCEDSYIVKCDGQSSRHSKEEMTELIPGLIGVVQEILPLGSVVEINPSYKNPKQNTVEHFEMVITHRYISPEREKSFFEYGGVPYPSGMLESGKVLFFTERSIRNVIHKGYSDMKDKKFVMAVKSALIIENSVRSVSFSDKYKDTALHKKKGNDGDE